MKLNILTTAALLALAGAAMTQSAKAQFTGASGDLILAFGNGTSTTNYELDLGQVSTYINATSTLNIANISADLTSVYGSGFFSDSTLQVGIVGDVSGGASNGLKNNSMLVSNASTTPYTALKGSTLGVDTTNTAAIYTPNSNTPAPTAGSTALSYEVPTSNGGSFATVSSKDGFSASTVSFNGSTAPILYLNILQPGSSSFVTGTSTELANGYFDVTSSGEVQYTVAVPEPSTYALMILGGALLFVWQARRKSVSSL